MYHIISVVKIMISTFPKPNDLFKSDRSKIYWHIFIKVGKKIRKYKIHFYEFD